MSIDRPPHSWMVIDTAIKKAGIPSAWPPPRYLTENSCTNHLAVDRVFPFLDDRAAIRILIHTVSILFADTRFCPVFSTDSSKMKEKIDLLLLANADSAATTLYRTLLRPRFMVISGNNHISGMRFSNLYQISSDTLQSFTFRLQRNETLIPVD